jgi:hypothetical protein
VAAALLAGPWWVFISLHGGTNPDFVPVTIATLQENIGRLPTIVQMAQAELLSPNWSRLWPLAALCGLIGGMAHVGAYLQVIASRRNGNVWREERLLTEGATNRRAAALLPPMILLYLVTMGLGYVFSGFVPYQEHIESSFYRLLAQVVPLLALWIAFQGIAADDTSA